MTIRWVINSTSSRTIGKWLDKWKALTLEHDLQFLTIASRNAEDREFLLQRRDGRTILRQALSEVTMVDIISDEQQNFALGISVELKSGRIFQAMISGQEGFVQ